MPGILARVSRGDQEAVQECLDCYGGLVWALVRRRTVSSADAEDAAQEIFIDIWKNADRFDASRGSEAAFITVIARRRLIDRYRRAQRRPQTETMEGAPEVAGARPEQLEAYAEARIAARALEALKPKEKHCILLSAYLGLSHGQIAETTGIPLGTVKTYVRRGLNRVRDLLRGDRKADGETAQ